MKYCCVNSCDNFKGTNDGIKMFRQGLCDIDKIKAEKNVVLDALQNDKHFNFVRFPKDREVAVKWNLALGIEADKYLCGHVCMQHFEDECFKTKRKLELKQNTVPTIFKTKQSNDADCTDCAQSIAFDVIENLTSSSAASTIAMVSQNNENLPIPHFSDDIIENPTSSGADYTRHIYTSSSIDTVVDKRTWCTECLLKDEIIEQKDVQLKTLRKKLRAAQKNNWHLESVKRKLDTSLLDLKNQSIINEQLSDILEVCILCVVEMLQL